MKTKKSNFIYYLLIFVIIGVFAGYFWRMSQEAYDETTAFEAGYQSAIKEFKKILLQYQNSSNVFYLHDFRITPRNDGKFIINIEEVGK